MLTLVFAVFVFQPTSPAQPVLFSPRRLPVKALPMMSASAEPLKEELMVRLLATLESVRRLVPLRPTTPPACFWEVLMVPVVIRFLMVAP